MKRTYKTITKEQLLNLGIYVNDDCQIFRNGKPMIYVYRSFPNKYANRDKNKYAYIQAYIDGHMENGKWKNNYESMAVHRVIWAWFNDVCPGDLTVNHINHNKLDNHISNLELMTLEDNLKNKRVSRNQYTYNKTDEELLAMREQRKQLKLEKEERLRMRDILLEKIDAQIELAKKEMKDTLKELYKERKRIDRLYYKNKSKNC